VKSFTHIESPEKVKYVKIFSDVLKNKLKIEFAAAASKASALQSKKALRSYNKKMKQIWFNNRRFLPNKKLKSWRKWLSE
jgi:hypothetical protein